MTSLALYNKHDNSGNSYWDLYLDQLGNIAIVKDSPDSDISLTNINYNYQELLQSVATNIKLWLGEYDYDTSQGIPYSGILGSDNLDLLNYYIKEATNQVANVAYIVKLDYKYNSVTRHLSATITIRTKQAYNLELIYEGALSK